MCGRVSSNNKVRTLEENIIKINVFHVEHSVIFYIHPGATHSRFASLYHKYYLINDLKHPSSLKMQGSNVFIRMHVHSPNYTISKMFFGGGCV